MFLVVNSLEKCILLPNQKIGKIVFVRLSGEYQTPCIFQKKGTIIFKNKSMSFRNLLEVA